jgi:hypothetical protein
MITVADTTPLCHLIWIELDWLLPRFFGEVHIPAQVVSELKDAGAPDGVRNWVANPPTWVKGAHRAVCFANPPRVDAHQGVICRYTSRCT